MERQGVSALFASLGTLADRKKTERALTVDEYERKVRSQVAEYQKHLTQPAHA